MIIDRPAPSLRSSTAAVLAVRCLGAALHLAFAVPLVAVRGPGDAGRILAAVSAIELASLIGRLGLPVELARRHRLEGPAGVLPTGELWLSMAASALVAAAIGLAVDLAPPALVIGAVTVTAGQTISGWHRGGGRYLLASLAHPAPALLAAVIGLATDVGHPIWWYVGGATLGAGFQLRRAAGDLVWTSVGGRAAANLIGTLSLGVAGMANHALLLALPVLLVAQGHAETATVLSLALGAYRPILILQAGVNFTIGPSVAAALGVPLDAEQRRRLDRAAGIQQVAFVPYALVAGLAVAAAGAGLGIGHRLPTLLATWLILLLGHAIAIGTGPTGQLLLMRGNERSTVLAAAGGLLAALLCLLLPLEPWLRAGGAVSASLAVQNLLTARAVWGHDRWSARPDRVWPSGLDGLGGALRTIGAARLGRS